MSSSSSSRKAADPLGAISAADVQAKRVKWLWRERIPRGFITTVGGKPDQGKGLFSAHLAADVSRKGGRVIYSAMEDDHGYMTKPRLAAAGASLENIILWRFTLPGDLAELAAMVEANEADLIVMDPFTSHVPGYNRGSDKIRDVLTPLTKLCETTGVSILVIEHALKRVSAKAHPLTAIAGSGSGLAAASRMAYVFGKDPQDSDTRVLANVKSNLRPEPEALVFEMDTSELDIVGEVPALVFDREAAYDAIKLVTSEAGDDAGRGGRKPEKRAAAAEWLVRYLHAAGKPVAAKQIQEDVKQYGHGLTARTVRRAADELGVLRSPASGGPKCTWDLPPELRKAMDQQQQAQQQQGGGASV